MSDATPNPTPPTGRLDWGISSYETTAIQLAPATTTVVEHAALQPGLRVLDLGCGTGNAALAAARLGAQVVGVDPASRLLDVARERAAQESPAIEFRSGEAAAIPLDDAAVDVIISVFAVFLAPDPVAAAAEVSRVLAPNGRFVFSTWLPDGAVNRAYQRLSEEIATVTGAPPPAPRFSWHETATVTELLAPHGLQVQSKQYPLPFRAASAEEWLDQQIREHPVAATGFATLRKYGDVGDIRARMLDLLQEGNEDNGGSFQATSHYVVITASR